MKLVPIFTIKSYDHLRPEFVAFNTYFEWCKGCKLFHASVYSSVTQQDLEGDYDLKRITFHNKPERNYVFDYD